MAIKWVDNPPDPRPGRGTIYVRYLGNGNDHE